ARDRDARRRRRGPARARGRAPGRPCRRRAGRRSVIRLAGLNLLRAPWRSAARIVVLAAAVGLLGAMVIFVGHSLRTMTGSAVRSVPLGWQGPVGSEAAAIRVARETARQWGVRAALPAATAPFSGVEHTAPDGVIRAGSGAVLAVPPGYATRFRTLRFLHG